MRCTGELGIAALLLLLFNDDEGNGEVLLLLATLCILLLLLLLADSECCCWCWCFPLLPLQCGCIVTCSAYGLCGLLCNCWCWRAEVPSSTTAMLSWALLLLLLFFSILRMGLLVACSWGCCCCKEGVGSNIVGGGGSICVGVGTRDVATLRVLLLLFENCKPEALFFLVHSMLKFSISSISKCAQRRCLSMTALFCL